MPRSLALCLLLVSLAGCGRGGDGDVPPTRQRVSGQPDVGFVVTPDPVVAKMVEVAEIRPGDVVYDLGCGDGRIVIAAAKAHGVKAVGIEIDAKVADEARANVKAAGLEHLVTIKQGDIFEEDFGDATVVMMYLLPELNLQLKPKLAQLPAGSRIVSHSFPMKGAKPERVETVLGKKVYFWRVPWVRE